MAKFPMNSNFLNLLKKKNIENVKNQQNAKNQSIGPINKLKEKTSKVLQIQCHLIK